ncbi:MAG: histidine kinase [Bacteroidia bacterium]|nr:histidine kinase [Bacteroidia bacterium]
MKLLINSNDKKQALMDSLYFWSFWILFTGLLVGIAQSSLTEALKAVSALIIPQIIPAFLVSVLFDVLFMKKRIALFFIISIPLCYGFGIAINFWFRWIMKGANMQVNNEILIFVFTSMYIGFRYVRVAISQRILLKEEENKRVTAELQYLRSQLNPHFLFNALNSIYSLILTQSDKAGEATLNLSELMRFHIDLSGKQFIELGDEIAMAERYIALEKLKLQGRCNIQFTVSGTAEKIKIAPLIFMPFLENAFKHGISSDASSNFVRANLIINPGLVLLEISNSIPQKKIAEKTAETKVGIENTIKRLDLHYKNAYTFNSSVKENVYSMSLKIDLTKHAA